LNWIVTVIYWQFDQMTLLYQSTRFSQCFVETEVSLSLDLNTVRLLRWAERPNNNHSPPCWFHSLEEFYHMAAKYHRMARRGVNDLCKRLVRKDHPTLRNQNLHRLDPYEAIRALFVGTCCWNYCCVLVFWIS